MSKARHAYATISRELSLNRLLYVDFPTNSREILMEFFRTAETVYTCRPPPLNKNQRGRGVCTQAINLPLQKGIALLTLQVNNNQ